MIHSMVDEFCQRVLLYFPQPIGEVKSFFQNWKTSFKVVKKLDVDSYFIPSETDQRKQYIVYRSRLKPIGAVEDTEMSASGQKVSPVEEEGEKEIEENDIIIRKPNLRSNTKEDSKYY